MIALLMRLTSLSRPLTIAALVSLGRMGEAFGNLMGAFLLAIQAIRNLGQAQAMQSMADHLALSQPVRTEEREP